MEFIFEEFGGKGFDVRSGVARGVVFYFAWEWAVIALEARRKEP